MKLLLISLTVLPMLVVMMSMTRSSSAHNLGADSVDCGSNGCQIRWGSSTRYTGARDYAISEWNELNKVGIKPDIASTIQDLTFDDYAGGNNGTEAYWTPRTGADAIFLTFTTWNKIVKVREER